MQSIMRLPFCPHCFGRNVIFEYRWGTKSQYSKYHLSVWVCPLCYSAVCTETYKKPVEGDNGFNDSFFHNVKIYPSIEDLDAPDGTPGNVADAYRAALVNLKTEGPGFWEAAAIMARRSIELAIAGIDGVKKGSLKSMIDEMGAKGLLTKAMVDWANEVRIIGNEGAHENGLTREDAEQAVYFAEMLFTYIFKLPGMLEKRRLAKS